MLSILLSLKKIADLPVLPARKEGQDSYIKLKIYKVVKEKTAVTHVVCVPPTKEDILARRKMVVIGSGIKELRKVRQNPEMEFFMLYAEGGGVPVYQHGSYAEALKQADHLQQKIGKRIYIMKPIAFTSPVEITEEVIETTDSIIDEGITREEVHSKTKSGRKKIPNTTKKIK